MADDVAMFRFENNAAENAAEIAAALQETVSAIQEAAREAGGTQVPLNLGNQIVEQMERAGREGSEAMRRALHPSNFTGAVPIEAVNEVLAKSAAGAFQRTQRDVDTMLSQLGPKAQKAMVDSGQLNRIMGDYADAIISETRAAYENFRREVAGGLDRLPPLPDREELARHFAQNTGDPSDEGIGQQYVLQDAARRRIGRVFTKTEADDENGIDESYDVNSEAYLAAEVKANAARVKIAAAKSKEQLEEARKELGEAMASMVGSESPYAKAFGYHLPPGSAVPARPTPGGGYEEIVDPRKIAEAAENMSNLRQQVENTRRLLGEGGPGRQISKSPFFVDESSGAPNFYEKASQGGVQYLRLLDDTETRLFSLRDAQKALKREQNAPEERAKAEREAAEARAKASQDAKLAEDAKRTRGFIPGVVQGAFGSGFTGTGSLDQGAILGNLGKTVGSAARYSLAYGGFYQFLNAMRDGLAIFDDYQDSFTDYQVALGDTSAVTQATTNDLMELSRTLGENVGAAYDSAARGVRAFASDASDADKKIAGFATASAAQKVSVIANKSLTDATGDVVAIGGAYGMTASQAELLIPDYIANAKRNIGGDPTQISQGLSNFAVTGQEAGFSGQEAANLIALIQSRTDQSGQAVSTRLSRIVQAVSGTPGKSLAQDVNRSLGEKVVDINDTPKLQLEQFARAYVLADQRGVEGLQSLIRTKLGGTSNLKELIPLLEQSGQDALASALKKATPGAGNDEYNRKVSNLIGTMNKLRGSIQNIVVLAANADLFAPFAIAVKTAEPLLHLLENILKVYEKIESVPGDVLSKVPGGNLVGPLATTGAEAYLGYRAFKGIQKSAFAADVAKGTGIAGATARAAGAGADVVSAGASVVEATASVGSHRAETGARIRNTEAIGAETIATGRLAAASNAAAAALGRLGIISQAGAGKRVAEEAAGGLGGFFGKTGKFLTSKLGLAGLALGAGVIGQEIYTKQRTGEKFRETRADLLSSIGSDPKKLQTTVDALNSLSKNQQTDLGWLDKLQKFGSGTSDAQQTTADAKVIQSIQKRVAAEDRLNSTMTRASVFGDAASRTVESLTEAFSGLTERGVGAKAALDQYFKALMTPSADTQASYETPDSTAAALLSNIEKGLGSALPDKVGLNPGDSRAGRVGVLQPISNDKALAQLSEQFDEGAAYKSLVKSIKGAGKGFDQADLQQAYADAFDVGTAGADIFEGSGALSGKRDQFRQTFLDQAALRFKIIKHQVGEIKPLSPAELTALLTAQDAASQAVDPGDPAAAARQARENYLQLLRRRAATGGRGEVVKRAVAGVGQGRAMYKAQREARDEAGRDFDANNIALRDRKFQNDQAAVAEAEDARAAAEARVKKGNTGQLKKVRLANATVSFDAADDQTSLIETLFEGMDRETVKALLAYRQTAVNEMKLALDHANKLIADAREILGDQVTPAAGARGILGGGGPKATIDPKLIKQRNAIRDRYRNQKKQQKAALEAYDRAAIEINSLSDSGDTPLTAYQVRTRTAQANEDPRNSTQVAYNNLQVAKADLAALGKKVSHKSAEYIAGMKAVSEAADAYSQNLNSMIVSQANLVAARAGGGATASAIAAMKIANNAIANTAAGTPERVDAETQKATAVWQGRAAAAQKIGSRANAEAARVGGGLASAKAQITGAAAQMHSLAKGTGEWYDALGSFYNGQEAMRQAVMQYKNNLDLLKGDSTDPVEQARDALRAAQRQLRNSRSKDDKAAARVAVQDARNQLQQTKFEQRLSDLNTNESLDRITFAQKMSVLDHEHDRLSKIKHRTRQQQDQLNEVDQAIKDANSSMEAQFNLGDIDTKGLVYQVRRFKAEASSQIVSRPDQFARGGTTNQRVTISINGADTAKVRSILDSYLRIGGGQRQSLTRRKA